MTTISLAKEACNKAKAMGWKTYANFDLSDVLDMAGVVAFHPNKKRARVARWTEGRLDYSKWIVTEGVDVWDVLEQNLARCDAYGELL